MCRNIKPLYNFDPPATDAEIRDAALQFVRKISGYKTPSKENERAFANAVVRIEGDVSIFLASLTTNAPKKNRERESQRAKARSEKRFGKHV